MNQEFPQKLMGMVTRPGRHVWIGQCPPLDWEALDLNQGTNYRASSVHHQQYDTVWYYQDSFHQNSLHHLELLLDEMVRLLSENGVLIVRYEEAIVFTLKRLLARRLHCRVDVEIECLNGSEYITAFRINRERLDLYRDPRWTFGVLTTGARENGVVSFLKSIREQREGSEQEIIVCGPPSASYEAYDVKYLEQSYRADVAEICKKKNDIAAAASHPNLLIAHDRYTLNPDFFVGFDRFGYDFDFLTVRQWFHTGEEFPTYCSLENDRPFLSVARMLRRYDALYPGHFLNGGMFAIKTHTMRAVPMIPVLYWAQAEDVEFTRTLRDHGLPPRINCFASAETKLTGERAAIYRRDYRIDEQPLPDEATTTTLTKKWEPLVAGKMKMTVEWAMRNRKRAIAYGMASAGLVASLVMFVMIFQMIGMLILLLR